ncbi:MAG: mechanosensitive ion channel family protein [Pseudomonadota bacterium]
MDEWILRVQGWAEVFGPNPYVQAGIIAIVFVIIGKLADLILSAIAGRLVRKSKTDIDDRVIALLHRPIFLTFVLIGLAMATRRMDLGETPEYVTLGILGTIAIFVWYSMLRQLVDVIVTTLKKKPSRKIVESGMLQLIQLVVKILLLALLVYFVIVAWEGDPTAWVASAGIVGLALSFAARDSLSNLFAGVSIVADAPYKTGDFITLDSGERGVVTFIGLRSTRLLTRDDIEITIPNGLIGNSKITNEAGGPSQKHRIRIAAGVSYGSDVDQVVAVLEGVANDHDEVCNDPSPRVRMRGFGESSLDFELLCWIDRPIDRGRLRHELFMAVYKALNANNIGIPFPTREVHVNSLPTDT